MRSLRRGDDPHALVIGMAGLKMGDRLAQIGCAHGARLAAIAGKVGLSGRAVALVPDAASADRARRGAEKAGVLVEIIDCPPSSLALDATSIDVLVIDDTARLFTSLSDTDRASTSRDVLRVLRPGGRVLVIAATPASGLGAWLGRATPEPPFDPTRALEAVGFRSVRKLGEGEGLVFVEGLKPRT